MSTLFVAPNGSDKNPGTISQPYLTIQAAANVANPGDTVDVEAGNYAGFILGWVTPKSGLPGLPITFEGEPGANIVTKNSKTQDGIDLEGSSWVTIEGFNINGMGRTGIRTNHGTNVVIENNVCNANGYWGIETSFDDNLLIEHNIASNSVRQHGIYVGSTCVNPQVIDNVLFGNHECGLHMNGDVSQGGLGVISGAVIEGNIIYDNGVHGGGAINLDGVQNSLIANNLLFDNHHSGIAVFQQDASAGSINDTIVNNTIIMDYTTRDPVIELLNGATGATINHNIFFEPNVKPSWANTFDVSNDSLPGLSSDYNAFMGFESNDTTGVYYTLANWQKATGQEMHSFNADASLFVSPYTLDFHVVNSPIANLGSQMLPVGAINFFDASATLASLSTVTIPPPSE